MELLSEGIFLEGVVVVIEKVDVLPIWHIWKSCALYSLLYALDSLYSDMHSPESDIGMCPRYCTGRWQSRDPDKTES